MRKIITYVLIIVLCFILAPAVISANPEPEMPERYTYYVVHRGDSLWTISEKILPAVDNRLAIRWIQECNNLPRDYMIQPGDVLNVPDEDGAETELYGQD